MAVSTSHICTELWGEEKKKHFYVFLNILMLVAYLLLYELAPKSDPFCHQITAQQYFNSTFVLTSHLDHWFQDAIQFDCSHTPLSFAALQYA